MTDAAKTAPFAPRGHPLVRKPDEALTPAAGREPLEPLAALLASHENATSVRAGFNAIRRPHRIAGSGQERLLKLNLTTEKLPFPPIKGKIANRGPSANGTPTCSPGGQSQEFGDTYR